MTNLFNRYSFLGLFLLSFCLSIHSQTKLHKLTIEVDFHDFGIYHEYWNQIELVSKDTVLTSYLSRAYKQIRIDSIPTGSYTVRLLSVFGHVITDSITFDKRITKKIQFENLDNYYEILENKPLFYQSMQDSDTLVILYSETGCFHSDFGKMQFIKTGNTWLAQLYNPFTGKLLEQRKIQIEKFTHVVAIERYMNQSNDSYECTTVAYYSLQFDRKIKRHIDGSCSWDGYRKLKEDIFGNK